MKVRGQIGILKKALREEGFKGSEYEIAKLLGVQQSTVLRWRQGETEPRQKKMEALVLLKRVVLGASQGHNKASRILAAFHARPGLAGQGLVGIAIACGLSWLLVPLGEGEST